MFITVLTVHKRAPKFAANMQNLLDISNFFNGFFDNKISLIKFYDI